MAGEIKVKVRETVSIEDVARRVAELALEAARALPRRRGAGGVAVVTTSGGVGSGGVVYVPGVRGMVMRVSLPLRLGERLFWVTVLLPLDAVEALERGSGAEGGDGER